MLVLKNFWTENNKNVFEHHLKKFKALKLHKLNLGKPVLYSMKVSLEIYFCVCYFNLHIQATPFLIFDTMTMTTFAMNNML